MENYSKIIIAVIVIGLILGWLLEPAFTVIAGGILLFSIFLVTGGAEDGNPYRTMTKLPMPNVFSVGRFMRQQKVAKEKPRRRNVILALVFSGFTLIAIGIIWMYWLGMW